MQPRAQKRGRPAKNPLASAQNPAGSRQNPLSGAPAPFAAHPTQFQQDQFSTPHPHQPLNQQPPSAAPRQRGIGSAIGRGLLIKAGIFGVLLVVGLILARGTTSASALEVGDCFIRGDGVDITTLETPDCTEPHDSQVVGLVEVQGPEAYPGPADPYWEEVFFQCQLAAASTMVNIDFLPQDTQFDFFHPQERGWDRGDREVICVIHAAGGLSGSFTSTPS